MPFTLEHREPGVYVLTWDGVITRDKLIEFIQYRAALTEQHGVTRYALIVDLTRATLREFDIHTTRDAVEDPNLLAVFVINPSMIIQTIIKLLRQITRKPIKICSDYEEALTRAREVLSR